MLGHNVFFSLHDRSETAKRQLVEDCHKYLAAIPGMLFYAAGTCSDMSRPVNDRDYDVALHTFFEDKATMELYLEHPKHQEFLAKHKESWARVRVFDSEVTRS